MGFIDYLEQNGEYRKAATPNIAFKYPVLNIFIGKFLQEDIGYVIELFKERVGESAALSYLYLEAEDENSKISIENLDILSLNGSVKDINNREQWKETFASEEVKTNIRQYIVELDRQIAAKKFPESGKIRLNFIINCIDPVAACAEELIMWFREKEIFNFISSTNVIVDAYCIVDQGRGNANPKQYQTDMEAAQRCLQEIEQLAINNKVYYAYLLSNYNSSMVLETTERLLSSIVLATILNSGVGSAEKELRHNPELLHSLMQPEENQIFFTMGYLHFDLLSEAIEYITYAAALDLMKDSVVTLDREVFPRQLELQKENYSRLCTEIIGNTDYNNTMLLALVINQDIRPDDMIARTNGENIKNIFEKNLEQFFECNYVERAAVKVSNFFQSKALMLKKRFAAMMEGDGYSIYQILELLNYLEEGLKKQHIGAQMEAEAKKAAFQKWLVEQSMDYGTEKIKGIGIGECYYRLAGQYLEIRKDCFKTILLNNIIQAYINCISELKQEYQRKVTLVEAAKQEIFTRLEVLLQNEEELKAGNIKPYYSELCRKKMLGNTLFFRNLGRLDGENLYKSIIEECRKRVLSDLEQTHDFADEMLARLRFNSYCADDMSVYEKLFQTIADEEIYCAHLLVDTAQKREICAFANTKNNFITYSTKTARQLQASHHMTVFLEQEYHDIGILFMKGCINYRHLSCFNRGL